jgi:hypothetical protein
MTIKNHRALKAFINKQQLVPSESRSVDDVIRANTKFKRNIVFNGLDIHTIVAEMEQQDGKLVLEKGCDNVLKGISNRERKRHYQEFLRLYLHQGGIFQRGVKLLISQLAYLKQGEMYFLDNSKVEYSVNFYVKNQDLYIEDEFFVRRINKGPMIQLMTPEGHDHFFHGKARFKLEMVQQNGLWVPRLVILQSTLDCPDPYFRKLIDKRNFWEKLIDFLKGIFRITTQTPVQTFTFFNSPSKATSSCEEEQNQVPASACSH